VKTEEILQHLGDLKSEAEGHYTDDGDDEIFHQDAEALQAAIDAVKSNAKIVDAIDQEIGIRKASDSILQAEERRVNYGDQKLVLGSLLEILNLKKE
jgi:acetylornithine/succinyldiaminopimelate/putrescine aminotransferase